MNLHWKNFIWLFSLTLMVGCASSYLTSSHSNIDEKKQYKKIMVVAKAKSQTIRAKFEQQITDELIASGVNATTSNTFVPHSAIRNKPTKAELESLRQKLLSNGIDGVIITSLIDRQDYVEVIPGSAGGYPHHMSGYGRYWGYHPAIYWEPDRLVSGVSYYLESALYDITMDDDNLHWVGAFKVKNPGEIDTWSNKFAADLSNALMDENSGAITNAISQ